MIRATAAKAMREVQADPDRPPRARLGLADRHRPNSRHRANASLTGTRADTTKLPARAPRSRSPSGAGGCPSRAPRPPGARAGSEARRVARRARPPGRCAGPARGRPRRPRRGREARGEQLRPRSSVAGARAPGRALGALLALAGAPAGGRARPSRPSPPRAVCAASSAAARRPASPASSAAREQALPGPLVELARACGAGAGVGARRAARGPRASSSSARGDVAAGEARCGAALARDERRGPLRQQRLGGRRARAGRSDRAAARADRLQERLGLGR